MMQNKENFLSERTDYSYNSSLGKTEDGFRDERLRFAPKEISKAQENILQLLKNTYKQYDGSRKVINGQQFS